MKSQVLRVAGLGLEVFEAGAGAPLLLLHGHSGFDPADSAFAALAKHRHIICPSHPGFGKSELPDWIDRIEDIAPVHLELLDHLSIRHVDVLGFSIGGWLAAEMATVCPERFGKLVMVGPVGVKTGPMDRLDVPDIFAMTEAEVDAILHHDPARIKRDPKSLTEEELAVMFRNRESLALMTWEPYMHNPKLKHRMHRVTAPVLLIRGESDGFISQDYLKSYAKLFPDARVVTIGAAGHAPQLSQPQEFAEAVLNFLVN